MEIAPNDHILYRKNPDYRQDTDEYACQAWKYDPESSNQILDELGRTDTTRGDGVRERDGQELTFPVMNSTEEALSRAVEVILGQLADIGIGLELNSLEPAAQVEILLNETRDFFIRPYEYPDPVILSWILYYPHRNVYNDPHAQELAPAADSSLDDDARWMPWMH